MFQNHRFHGCSHYDFRHHLPCDHRVGKLDDPLHSCEKRDSTLSSTWNGQETCEADPQKVSFQKLVEKIGNKFFYTNNGEHALMNEIMKKIFTDYANNR